MNRTFFPDSPYTKGESPEGYKQRSYYIPSDIVEKEFNNEILRNLLLTWVGCYIKAYGHKVNHRILEDYVIIYCVEGRGWLELENKHWPIKKGDFFVCPPFLPHSYGADGKDPWTKYWIHFRGRNAANYMDLLGITRGSPVLHIGENTKILSCLQDIFNIMETGYTQSNLLAATSYLGNILCSINCLLMNEGLNKVVDVTIEKVISYMLDNLSAGLTLEQLSDFAGISRYHFVRIFKQKTGYTPINYYIRLKVQKACELLDASAVTISSISTALGFSSPYYFSLTFKRITGHSPQCYREMLHQG